MTILSSLSCVVSELPNFQQAPIVKYVDEKASTVRFFAWQGQSTIFRIEGYTIDYMYKTQVWTTYSRMEAIEGQDVYEVSVADLQVSYTIIMSTQITEKKE